MPKCEKCNCFLPPNYVEIIKNSQPGKDGKYPYECVFCKKMISSVERETKHNSGKYVEYTKEQCIKDYKVFLKKLKDRNVKDIINQTNKLI